MQDVLAQYYQMEETMLSPYAFPSNATRGRELEIKDCDLRTDFQRDRDRIIHCQSFRHHIWLRQTGRIAEFGKGLHQPSGICHLV